MESLAGIRRWVKESPDRRCEPRRVFDGFPPEQDASRRRSSRGISSGASQYEGLLCLRKFCAKRIQEVALRYGCLSPRFHQTFHLVSSVGLSHGSQKGI